MISRAIIRDCYRYLHLRPKYFNVELPSIQYTEDLFNLSEKGANSNSWFVDSRLLSHEIDCSYLKTNFVIYIYDVSVNMHNVFVGKWSTTQKLSFTIIEDNARRQQNASHQHVPYSYKTRILFLPFSLSQKWSATKSSSYLLHITQKRHKKNDDWLNFCKYRSNFLR